MFKDETSSVTNNELEGSLPMVILLLLRINKNLISLYAFVKCPLYAETDPRSRLTSSERTPYSSNKVLSFETRVLRISSSAAVVDVVFNEYGLKNR